MMTDRWWGAPSHAPVSPEDEARRHAEHLARGLPGVLFGVNYQAAFQWLLSETLRRDAKIRDEMVDGRREEPELPSSKPPIPQATAGHL
jgi:hypothetical protein